MANKFMTQSELKESIDRLVEYTKKAHDLSDEDFDRLLDAMRESWTNAYVEAE